MTRFRQDQGSGSGSATTRGNESSNSLGRVVKAYESPRIDVEGMLGTNIAPDDPDRAVIEPWAEAVAGRILDVGSGTGRWTGHLARMGYSVEGLEPVERLIDTARAEHPSVNFHHGSMEDLTGSENRWEGILAWYSLIHLGPQELPQALATLRAVLQEGGSLLMSFFSGPRQEAFDHPVTTAYRWPMADLIRILTRTGFSITEQGENSRTPHAYINARAAKR